MARRKADTSDESTESSESTRSASQTVNKIRTRVAQLVWLLFVICALFLAVGALLIALDANQKNGLVDFVLRGADAVDLGIFSRNNGIKEFRGDGADVKNALLNWGLGAVAYLVVGKILDRIIRP